MLNYNLIIKFENEISKASCIWCEYLGRKLWCITHKVTGKQVLLYSSSGCNATKNTTWPIAGVYHEKFGNDKMNLFVTKIFGNNLPCDGWIGKHYRDQNDMKSYLNFSWLKDICLGIENLLNNNFLYGQEVTYEEWRKRCNSNMHEIIY